MDSFEPSGGRVTNADVSAFARFGQIMKTGMTFDMQFCQIHNRKRIE